MAYHRIMSRSAGTAGSAPEWVSKKARTMPSVPVLLKADTVLPYATTYSAGKNGTVQLVKTIIEDPQDDNEDLMSVNSDFEEKNTETTINDSYTKKPKTLSAKNSQIKSVKKIRSLLKENLKKAKKSDKRYVSKKDFQRAIAIANKTNSSENTIALNVSRTLGSKQSKMIVTKMGGVVPNYLKKLIKADKLVLKREGNKTGNKFHAEKVLSELVKEKDKNDVIINKPRCEHCLGDKNISKFKGIYDEKSE